MATEVRHVRLTIDPALAAYLEHLEQTGKKFSPSNYDLFSAGFRACCNKRTPLDVEEDDDGQ